MMSLWPSHWSLMPLGKPVADMDRLFRRRNARGRYLATFRRFQSFGPWTFYLGRYMPGQTDESTLEAEEVERLSERCALLSRSVVRVGDLAARLDATGETAVAAQIRAALDTSKEERDA